MRLTHTHHVAAAPDEIFRYVVDRDVFSPAGTTVEAVHETPAIEGNVYIWKSRMFGLPFTGVMVYTDYVPGRRLTVRNLGRFESTTSFTVEPEGDGCRLTVDNAATLHLPLADRFVGPLLRREMDAVVRSVRADLERPRSRVGTAA